MEWTCFKKCIYSKVCLTFSIASVRKAKAKVVLFVISRMSPNLTWNTNQSFGPTIYLHHANSGCSYFSTLQKISGLWFYNVYHNLLTFCDIFVIRLALRVFLLCFGVVLKSPRKQSVKYIEYILSIYWVYYTYWTLKVHRILLLQL